MCSDRTLLCTAADDADDDDAAADAAAADRCDKGEATGAPAAGVDTCGL
jgi:hypothetical protein